MKKTNRICNHSFQKSHQANFHNIPDQKISCANLVLQRRCNLDQRGLLKDTLVIWGGEFGRTPFLQGNLNERKKWGRDHHPYAYTIWMAGGGVKPGISYGASDDLAFSATENPVHVHDIQATWLHLAGIDHERLTYKFQGRRFRLTDVHGKVVTDIMG